MLGYRAWRFNHPVFDAREKEPPGLSISPTGGIEMVEDNAAVRQAILALLSTRPGERVMRPEYGCNLHLLVFSPTDDTTAGLAIHYVRQALNRWEPRVEILTLDAGRNPSAPEQLDIRLEYRDRAIERIDSLSLGLNLGGEGN